MIETTTDDSDTTPTKSKRKVNELENEPKRRKIDEVTGEFENNLWYFCQILDI